MPNLLVKNVLLNGTLIDILVEGNKIKKIGPNLSVVAEKTIDGNKKTVIPGFVNTHTHVPMTLFRGFADDLPLMDWLQNMIWPNEAKLTEEDVYWGAKLGCLEMIKTGTTTFLDMYPHFEAIAKAVEETGIRATLSAAIFDFFNPEVGEKYKKEAEQIFKKMNTYSDRLTYALGPHAIYTVSADLLKWCNDFSKENEVPIHLHLSETEIEVQNSIKDFGLSPVRYLKKLGVLSPRLIIAHVLHIDDEELQILSDYGVKVAHNPASNMKLASGMHFKYDEMRDKGITVGLGTDGCASSNNLDMVEAMKLAALLGKASRLNPESVKADDIFYTATKGGADVVGLNAGEIKEGLLADFSLVDTRTPAMYPNFNFVSNLVYAANGSCIDTVVCNGKVLMQDKKVEGEWEIMEQAAQKAYELVKR